MCSLQTDLVGLLHRGSALTPWERSLHSPPNQEVETTHSAPPAHLLFISLLNSAMGKEQGPTGPAVRGLQIRLQRYNHTKVEVEDQDMAREIFLSPQVNVSPEQGSKQGNNPGGELPPSGLTLCTWGHNCHTKTRGRGAYTPCVPWVCFAVMWTAQQAWRSHRPSWHANSGLLSLALLAQRPAHWICNLIPNGYEAVGWTPLVGLSTLGTLGWKDGFSRSSTAPLSSLVDMQEGCTDKAKRSPVLLGKG